MQPPDDGFTNLIKLIKLIKIMIKPIIFCAEVVCVAAMGDRKKSTRKVGRACCFSRS